jgi:glycosyltransferase involved in cell wall biosynthesis
MSNTLVSLITCTLGRKAKLDRFLNSLINQTNKNFELILIDQNEKGFLTEIIEKYTSHFSIIHKHTAKGLSLGRNVGLSLAKGQIIAFPDDDCWYKENTLDQVIGLFYTNKDQDFILGRTIDEHGKQSVSPTLDFSTAVSRENYLECGNSNTIFAKAQSVRLIDGFDIRLGVGAQTPFQSGEESDFLLCAIQKKQKLHYTPDLIIYHDSVEKMSTEDYLLRVRKYGAGFGALMNKHNFGIINLSNRIFRSIAGGLIFALKGNFLELKYRLSWVRGVISGYYQWEKKYSKTDIIK